MKKFTLVYIRNSTEMTISKKKYKSWEEIANEFSNYLTSLSFNSIDKLIQFLKEEYQLDHQTELNLINFDSDQSDELKIEIINN